MGTPSRTLAATATVAGLLLVGACGNGRPSHTAFATKVDAICTSSAQQHQAASKGFDFDSFNPDTSDLAPLILIIEKHVAIGRLTAHRIDAVKGPAADEAKADQWVANANRLHQLGDQELAALRNGDRATFKTLARQEDDLHARHGDSMFKDC